MVIGLWLRIQVRKIAKQRFGMKTLTKYESALLENRYFRTAVNDQEWSIS
jgi:hypothetical protein